MVLDKMLDFKEYDNGEEVKMRPEEIKLYRQLMVEANSQLGLVKLPREAFGEFENLIKLTQYNQFKEMLGEDPILNHKKQLISAQNQ